MGRASFAVIEVQFFIRKLNSSISETGLSHLHHSRRWLGSRTACLVCSVTIYSLYSGALHKWVTIWWRGRMSRAYFGIIVVQFFLRKLISNFSETDPGHRHNPQGWRGLRIACRVRSVSTHALQVSACHGSVTMWCHVQMDRASFGIYEVQFFFKELTFFFYWNWPRPPAQTLLVEWRINCSKVSIVWTTLHLCLAKYTVSASVL